MTEQASAAGSFHSTALVVWCSAALLPVVLTSNPLYLGLTLLSAWTLFTKVARGSEEAEAWGGFARFGAFFVLISMALNLFFGTGGETVLVELPSWQPAADSPFQIGGSLTLEGLVLALSSAMALVTVILVLAVFNTLVDHYLLLRSLPAFLYQAATVISIGLALLPQWVRAQREIRQAQALRGHQVRGFRDFLPLIWALLAEALEKALLLAESMESRGFGSSDEPARGLRWILALSLASIFGGWVLFDLEASRWLAVTVAGVGGVLLIGALRQLGKRSRRSRHRRQGWGSGDRWLVIWSAASMGMCGVLAKGSLFAYEALPAVMLPSFSFLAIVPMTVMVAPWWLAASRQRSDS